MQYGLDSMRMYDAGHDDIVYSRAVRDPIDGQLWLQYWLFYYYNSFETADLGVHEGDWEMVQIGIDPAGNPTGMTFAAHNEGYRCDWPEIDRGGASGVSPIVYVAGRSHAAYPAPGSTWLGDIPWPPLPSWDQHRGTGLWKILPQQTLTGSDTWSLWRGRWGASTDGEFRSPESPAQQGRWAAPSEFHENAASGSC